MIIAAAIALIWVNSPWGDGYVSLVNYEVGIPALGLELSLGVWAADALLAIFFFVVGLELKHELIVEVFTAQVSTFRIIEMFQASFVICSWESLK